MDYTNLCLWACVASSQDDKEREVAALYSKDKCLAVVRSWIAPVHAFLHGKHLGHDYALFCAIMAMADYKLHQGVWFGELALPTEVLAALAGCDRRRSYKRFKKLQRQGYIQYTAGSSKRPPLIRVYPHNVLTGDPVLCVQEDWLLSFITKIEPRTLLARIESPGREPVLLPFGDPVADPTLAKIVNEAPILIQPARRAGQRPSPVERILPGNFTVIESIAHVPGLEDEYWLSLGIDPDLGESGQTEAENTLGTNWLRSWSEDKFRVEVQDENPVPAWGQIGLGTFCPRGGRPAYPHKNIEGSDNSYICRSNPILGSDRALAPTARPTPSPSAPPPGPPPAASALFTRAQSERQLQPGQLSVIYRQRGDRVSAEARRNMNPHLLGCIEEYEIRAGVPFCVSDLDFLSQAIKLSDHRFVFRAIGSCADFPPEQPGYFIVKDGMKHVLSNVESTRGIRNKPKAASPKPRRSRGRK